MAAINNIWNTYTDNTSYLFGGYTSSTSSSQAGNILGIDLGEYASITKGSYSKLIKAYYQKYGTEKGSSGISAKDQDSTVTKTTLKTNASNLYKAANALTVNGKDSVFKKKDIKDEETGKTVKGYDTDKIYKAVNNLVDSYNSLVKSSTDSSNNAVLRQTLNMIHATASNSSLLNKVGITINGDNTLSIDEETFKNADMNDVKSLFNGSGSLGDRIQAIASNIYTNVNNSFGNGNIYTSAGTFGNYTSGNILDSLL